MLSVVTFFRACGWRTLIHADPLQRDIREAERLVADCCALVAEWRDKLWTVIGSKANIQPSTLIKRDALLPLASVASTLEYYECLCDALVALDQQERRLALNCEQLEQKKAAFDHVLAGYSAAGMRVASLGRCISVLPTLLPAPTSMLYKRSHQWLEYRVIEELATAAPADCIGTVDPSGRFPEGRDNASDVKTAKAEADAAVVVQRIVTGVGEDLTSQSHRQLLTFLEAVESAATLATSSDDAATSIVERHNQEDKPLDALFLWRALSWLSSSNLALAASSIKQQPAQLPRQSSESATSQSANSLVDRLRRKVRLGALLMDCFSGNPRRTQPHKGSQQHQHGRGQPVPNAVKALPSALVSNSSSSSSLMLSQDARQRRRPFPGSAVGSSFLALDAAADTSQKDAAGELEGVLTALFTVVEDFWLDWKAAKLERRRDVERLLAAHGIRRARRASLRHLEITAVAAVAAAAVSASPGTSAVSDTSVSCSNIVRVKSLAEVLAEFNLYGHHTPTAENDRGGGGGRDSIAGALAKLLLSYVFFPNVLAEAAADWCELVMASRRPPRHHRQSISVNSQVAIVPGKDQGAETSKAMERESSARLLDFGMPNPALVALVADISPSPCRPSVPGKAGKSPLVFLPKCLLVYSPSTDKSAQRRAEKCLESMPTSPQALHILTWWRSSNQTPATYDDGATSRYYYDQLVALVTSASTPAASGSKQGRRFFAASLLDPTHFDAAVAMISRVVNDHALLAVPEWVAVCSLNVAARITSSKLTLLPRVFVNATDATAESATVTSADARRPSLSASTVPPGTSIDGLDAEAIAEHLGWLQSGLTAHDEGERELVRVALMRCLLPQSWYQFDEEDDDEDHRQPHAQDPVGDLEATSEQPAPKSSLATSPAALSSDLTADIAVARHSILFMVRESGRIAAINASSPTQAARDHVLQRVEVLFDHLRQTADALNAAVLASSASPPSFEPLMFPRRSLQREVETQNAFFRTLDAHLRTLLSPSSPRYDPTHSTAVACLSRGFVPLTWVASALDRAWKPTQSSSSLPCWPLAQVAVAQLALLLAYRFALLADWLSSGNRRQLTRTLDLAGVHDARGLLRDFKRHFAKHSGVLMRDVTLALVQDEGDDDDDDGSNLEEDGQSGLGAAIRRRRSDSNVMVVGLRVEGVVLLELERLSPGNETMEASTGAVVAFHSLPPCRLVCRLNLDGVSSLSGSSGVRDDQKTVEKSTRSGAKSRRVPLVVLASLSSFHSQSKPHPWAASAPSDERIDWVDLELEPSAVGISLQQQRHQSFDQDELTDDRDSDGISFALGVPLFATDDDASSAS